MFFYLLELILCKDAGLAQDPIWNADLAAVVKERDVIYLIEFLTLLYSFYSIGSKSAAPCLQSGQTKSSGSSSPS